MSESEESIARPSSALPESPSRHKSKVHLDHLGQVVKMGGRQRYRYTRTFTMVYDGAGGEEGAAAEKKWRLLCDAIRAIDISTDGLRRLYRILQQAAPGSEHSLVGPRAFKLAMMQNGMHDPILIHRLFEGFKESSSLVPRIDFRQFVRTLATMSKDAIEDRLELLFDVWDADDSGSLSYQELANHVVHDEPVHKKEPALHAFTGIWSQIKNFAAAHPGKEEEDEFTKREVASGEVTRENLVDAASRLPGVRLFFEHMLTRRPPKADELARHMVSRNVQARLRELDGQVAEEVRAGVRGDAPGTRPSTAGGGKKDVDVEKQRQQAIKEKTDAILKTVSMSHSSSLGAMHSSSAKAVAAARQQASEFARPKTVGPGTGTRGGGRPRRQMHGFVNAEGSKSTGALEPLSRQRTGTAVSIP